MAKRAKAADDTSAAFARFARHEIRRELLAPKSFLKKPFTCATLYLVKKLTVNILTVGGEI